MSERKFLARFISSHNSVRGLFYTAEKD